MGDKTSSKRKRRGDKISSKKKSRRKESKKRRRRSYDSVSSSSDDDSLYLERRSSSSETDHRGRLTKTNKRRHDSPLSDSDSSSSDGKRRKKMKARRSRVDLKDVKRKRRKRSVSVDITSGRKRKRSGKDYAVRPSKKSSKKKSKRVLSSSLDSDSKSCSLSQSRSCSSSGDDSRRKNKVVPDGGRERLRLRGSSKGKKKHEDRCPSYTSIGRGADPGFSVGYGDEELFPVDNSRRLRSVIIVADRRDEEENRCGMDPHKEEIVYDQNDYPSPRSPDSNEGGNKMESGNQSNVAFSDRISVENMAGDEVHELGKSRIGDGDHHQSEGYMNKSEGNGIETSVPVAALAGESLETILRQKALENLRKFRKMPQTSPRSNLVKRCNETNAATISGGTVDIVESNSIEQAISNAEKMNPIGGLRSEDEIPVVVKLQDNEDVEKKPRMADLSITPPTPSNGLALVECAEEDKGSGSPAVEAKAVSPNDTSPGAGVTKECSSSNIEPTPGEHSSEQTNDSSQFEKKTMTVMRGGELVQVSYKVYIPKKTPALARRQLKR